MLAPMGLRLSVDKTRVCHIDEGFVFLGFRIQRRAWHGRAGKRAIYTYPSKRSLAAVIGKVRTLTHALVIEHWRTCCAASTRAAGMVQLLPPRRVKARLRYLDHFAWWRSSVAAQAPPRSQLGTISRRYLPGGRSATAARDVPTSGTVNRYRYRGTPSHTMDPSKTAISWRAGALKVHVRFGGRAGETDRRSLARASVDASTYLAPWEGCLPRRSGAIPGRPSDGRCRQMAPCSSHALRRPLAISLSPGTAYIHSDPADRKPSTDGPSPGRSAGHARNPIAFSPTVYHDKHRRLLRALGITPVIARRTKTHASVLVVVIATVVEGVGFLAWPADFPAMGRRAGLCSRVS